MFFLTFTLSYSLSNLLITFFCCYSTRFANRESTGTNQGWLDCDGRFVIPLNFDHWYEARGRKQLLFLAENGGIIRCFGYQFYLARFEDQLGQAFFDGSTVVTDEMSEKLEKRKHDSLRAYFTRLYAIFTKVVSEGEHVSL